MTLPNPLRNNLPPCFQLKGWMFYKMSRMANGTSSLSIDIVVGRREDGLLESPPLSFLSDRRSLPLSIRPWIPSNSVDIQ